MKTFVFHNTSGTLKVEFVTDLIGSNLGNFTIMQIKGLSDVEKSLGLDFQQLPSSYKAFKEFAESKNFLLDLYNPQTGVTTAIVSSVTALNITTTTLDDATVGLAETTVLTCDTFANSGQGDHVIIENQDGETFSIWLDKDNNGTAPTGALHLAADYKIEVDIATGDTAAQVAGKVKAAIELDENWTGFETIVDNEDGSLDIVTDTIGNTTDADTYNSAEGGAGSLSVAVTDGVDAIDYEAEIEYEGGNGNITFEVSVGALPTGLSLNAVTGVISGICTELGEVAFTVKITDDGGATDTQALTITGVTGE